MRNQVEAAGRAGINARTINSADLHEWEEIQAQLAEGVSVDVLLIAPERRKRRSRSVRSATRSGMAWHRAPEHQSTRAPGHQGTRAESTIQLLPNQESLSLAR
jgi:hypothetical protein